VAPEFEASADFAFGKEAGQACRNLLADFRCGIHEELAGRGMRGCVAFDCQGAGQRVTQVTFGGRDWRDGPREAAWEMFNAFAIMRMLHEILWYLTEALTLPAARPIHADLASALERTEHLASLEADAFMLADVRGHREDVTSLLRQTSALVRASATTQADPHSDNPHSTNPADAGRSDPDLHGANLANQDLRAADLRGADLRHADLRDTDLRGVDLRGANLGNAKLGGADLRGADLGHADLARVDLRGADVRGVDLGVSIFLTQYQVNMARGDAATRLPQAVLRPAHWAS
jgi:Pentapeptide repeats (8 copies)